MDNILLVSIVLFGINAASYNVNYVKKVFEDSKIVPDILRVAPEQLCQVSYPCGAIYPGQFLSTKLTTKKPAVTWYSERCCFYTLLMLDPDAPSPTTPTERSLQHLIIGNIRGNNIRSGVLLTAYLNPQPPKGSPAHRYVFLIYKQPKFLFFDEQRLLTSSTVNRTQFNLEEFTKKYFLGRPLCGNFFYADYENSRF